MNNKGISGVVTTVSIIAVAIVLGLALGYLITSPIQLKLGPELSCTQLQLQSPLTIDSACYDSQTKEVRASIALALSATELNDFRFTLMSESETLSAGQCSDTCGTCSLLQSGETRTYYLESQENIKQITLSTQGCTLATAPVVPCAA